MLRGRIVLAFLLATAAGSARAAEPAREGVWIKDDLSAAQAEARKTGKPIFVVLRCER